MNKGNNEKEIQNRSEKNILNQSEIIILVVGDDCFKKNIISQLFSKFNVIEASSQKRVLELLSEFRVDVVISHTCLSDSDGFELTKIIQEQFNKIPIILVSDSDEKFVLLEALKVRPFDFLLEPIQSEVLLRAVCQSVEKIRFERDQALKHTQLILSERLAAVSILSGGIAHEINNPLQIIHGISEKILRSLRTNGLLDPEKEKLFQTQESAIFRIKQIVDSLRVYSLEKTKEDSTFEINQLIHDTIEIVNRSFEENGIKIVFNSSAMNPQLFGNPARFQQIIMNILRNSYNAIKKKETSGIIEIESKVLDNKAISIIIKDNGIGMTPKQLKNAFEPFYTTQEVGKSIGLGLAIVHIIVSQMNGEIYLDSKEGIGTTIELNFS